MNLGDKNYVKFDVEHDSDASVSWAKENTDLWRLVSTDDSKYKLLIYILIKLLSEFFIPFIIITKLNKP